MAPTTPAAGSSDDLPVKPGGGLSITRHFTTAQRDPWSEVSWEERSAAITGERGEKVFEQKGVEVPQGWSQLATNVVVSKYFRGPVNSPIRERSVRQLIGRVASTITRWGTEGGYFQREEDARAFHDELVHLLVQQKLAFNSPVWFNVGVEAHPQCSACFINSVEDNMESILRLAATEARLFKGGSGTGSNLSTIRSSREALSGGGTASGPVSFMRGYDAFAGVIKSGGKTRRAAKMVILNAEHPDILEFIRCKSEEEKKAWALIEAGYDGSFNVPGGAYDSVFFQNANHSVRTTDDFMRAVEKDEAWYTRAVANGQVVESMPARTLWSAICDSAWICGDPGLQFDTTINHWHTCSNTARIHASNPCSEYMFLDDSACNLASLNLMKFRKADGELDVVAFTHACEVSTLAQEIIVGFSSYPTPAIEKNSHDYRPLGLGFANLGALLMARGLPYDSDAGRAYAGAITALMCGAAYRCSARVASKLGPFKGYATNRTPFLRVMGQHRASVDAIDARLCPTELLSAARATWDDVLRWGEKHGFRNAQATVLAPTGTIGFMMDCDTTGIEPDIALVKYKKLVGGGIMKIVNQTVPEALQRLGYAEADRTTILEYIDKEGTIEGAPGLKPEHLPVFDCAFRAANGSRSIHYMGHIRMMAACQPFLSGAISKTVNMPSDATSAEIGEAYLTAWRMGLKAVAIYRDGCKRTQPLNTSLKKEEKASTPVVTEPAPLLRTQRHRMPDERRAITHKFSIAGHDGYITAGMYDDNALGEIFLLMSKEGSVVSGLMDSFATAVSLALQYGVPLQVLVDKFVHTRFEPSGFTTNPDIPIAKSLVDYIFRWLALKFPAGAEGHTTGEAELPSVRTTKASSEPGPMAGQEKRIFRLQADAPPCIDCGSIMIRNGACYKCHNCGSTSGCS
ncbi:MAG: vitamin B12-dependent ribonucleotide reductase [Myxococcota bacterium]